MTERAAPAGSPTGSESVKREASALAERIVRAGGDSVRAVLLYGSQLLGTRPDRHSAYDFVVIVDAYRPFYAALTAAGELPRPVWLMTSLARVLPPNTIAFAPDEGRSGIAKCLIISKDDFSRALGDAPRDHFLAGRLVQRVGVVWAAGAEDIEWVERRLASAREGVLDWTAPYLDGSFNAEELGRRMLEVSYRGELRPEARDRFGRIFEAQSDHFRATLPAVLERGVASGRLVREGERYRLAEDVSAAERRRVRRYFGRSKTRSTARWFKHMVTFANWLPYVVRKVERHTGRSIELTFLERKLPIVFLWPRAVYVLLTRPQREIDS